MTSKQVIEEIKKSGSDDCQGGNGMQTVLFGFLVIWIVSFLIFSFLVWRAPMLEEMLDPAEGGDSLQDGLSLNS